MSFILKIAPSFLKKVDTKLRVNYPWIWATKIHLHIYLALLLTTVFSIIGLLYSVQLQDVPSISDQNSFFSLLFIPAFLFCLLIIFNMSLFNTDKSHAYRFKYQEFFLFIIYFFTFCLPILIPISASMILNERIASLENNAQFELDKKQFNEGLPYFPSANETAYTYYPSDSTYLYNINPNLNSGYYSENDYYNSDRNQWEIMRDSIFYHKGIFEKERPKLYCTNTLNWDYGYYSSFLDLDYYDYFSETSEKDSLFNLYIINFNLNKNREQAKQHATETHALLKKYFRDDVNINPETVVNNYINNNYSENEFEYRNHIALAFNVASDNITSIHRAKLKSIFAWNKDFYFGMLIFIFCLTVAFQLFKNIHWKQLLLSLGVGAGLVTLIIVIAIVSRFNDRSILAITFVLPILFIVASIAGFFINKSNWMLNQVNILLTVFLPFYPMVVLAYLKEFHYIFQSSYFDKYKTYFINNYGEQEWTYTSEYYELVSDITFYTFIGGLIFYVIVWNTYFKILYLKQWSLPKNK